MAWWDRVASPMRRVWAGVATRLGMRKSGGLMRLRQEVSTCEYEDVHVMWELLTETGRGEAHHRVPAAATAARRSGGRGDGTHVWAMVEWARFGSRRRF